MCIEVGALVTAWVWRIEALLFFAFMWVPGIELILLSLSSSTARAT